MSHRDDDGGHTTASGDGDDDAFPEEDLSPEEELGEWVGAAEHAVPPEETSGKGWFGRVFGRAKPEDSLVDPDVAAAIPDDPDASVDVSVDDRDPREAADPDALSIFAAVPADAEDRGEQSIPEPVQAEPDRGEPDEDNAVVASEPIVSGSADDGDDPAAVESSEKPELHAEPAQPSFADLWGDAADEDSGLSEDVSDFSTFTSEDYLQATTREYAGLAEAVARAEEEGTQQIAVSAEIPGLESGLVGLDDVVTAAGEDPNAEVVEPSTASDLSMRVLTAVGLLILFGASLLSPYGIGALIVVVLAIAAGEMFAALIRGGHRPLSIFGFLGIAGAFFGTWASGPVAIPMALLLTAIGVLLFYATVPGRRSPLDNATLTILVAVWIGGLGGFAFDFLGSPDYHWLVLALVITVALMDVGSYFIGRRFGRRPLAPMVSPKKTVEGYVAGIIIAIGVGAAFAWAEPFDLTDGLLIGAVVAIVAPVGDLAVSVLKRALGVKDMGYILPGHGGVLDRVDAMIITIPALWIAYSWMGLLT